MEYRLTSMVFGIALPSLLVMAIGCAQATHSAGSEVPLLGQVEIQATPLHSK
jgi:hypothetical protein